MKRSLLIFFFAVAMLFTGSVMAQDYRLPSLDASPADIAILRESRGAPPIAKVVYSRPQLKGRSLATLAPNDKLWRTGANETTELTLYQDVTIGGEKVAAGTYSLYTIPADGNWTVIINKKLHTWGHFAYDESQDLVRFSAEAKAFDQNVEAFTITFANPGGAKKTNLHLAWSNTLVTIPVEF